MSAERGPSGTGHDTEGGFERESIPEWVAGMACQSSYPHEAHGSCPGLRRPSDPPVAVPGPASVSPAEREARTQMVQRGLEPAETLLELVDAIRQDTAGIGACISSIRYIASSRGDVPKSILEWLDRLEAHTQRLEGKCALALTGDAHAR